MNKKEAAVAFLKAAGMGNTDEAFAKYAAPKFIHHNQYFKGDRASLKGAMEAAHAASPNKSIEVKHVYQDGDTVITHSRVVRQNPQEPDIAVVHIFRFQGDHVVELWDLGQPLSKDSPNANGAF